MASKWAVLGRERELVDLERAWSDAVAGSGCLLVLDGEAGIGKTALAVTLVETAATVPVWVSCVGQEQPAPQGVLAAVVAGLGLELERASRGVDGEGRIVALADAFARAVAGGVDRPRLVVVDDLQWADEVSLRVLALAAPQLRESCVLVVATLLTGEALPSARRGAVAALLRAARRIAVVPVDEETAAQVADAAAPRRLRAQVRRSVVARARGNPLFLRELAILASIDPERPVDSLSLPETVRSVLERRLDGLDDVARSALQQLAVCGDDLAYRVAAAVLERPLYDVVDMAAQGADAGVIQPASLGRVRFTHPLVRDALAAAVPFPRRVRLHQRIGRRLVELVESGVDVDVALVASHLCAASPAGDVAAAIMWARRAAEDASAQLAYGAAADWYGRVLDALDVDPGAADRLEVLLRRGGAQEAAGDRAGARSTYLDAFRIARTRADVRGMGMSAVGAAGGSGFEITLGEDGQLAALDEAIVALGDGEASLRSMLLARRSVAGALRESPARRRSAAEEAIALAREASDAPAQCAAIAALCDVLSGPAHVEERVTMAGEMAEIAKQSPDPKQLLLALRLSAVAQLELGDVAGFDRTVDRYEAVAGGLRQPLYDWYVPLWRAMRRAMVGDLLGAFAHADRAEAIGLAAESDNATILVGCLRSFLAVDTGDVTAVATLDADGLPGLIEPWIEISNGYIAAARGERDLARRVADQLPHLLARVPEDSEYLPTLAQAARIVAWIGGHPAAATLYDLLLPHRRRFVVEGIGAYVHGPVERFLGLLAAVLGRPERDGHFAAARALTEAAGASMLGRLIDAESGWRVAARHAVATGVFRRDGEGWVISLDGVQVHMRDSKGLHDLATLVARPRNEIAALRLAGRAEPVSRGDAMLDDQARAAYRKRLSVIDAEIADAEAAADLGRLERARVEREFLIAELAQAAGLGGRVRRMGDEVERARTAVTARVRDAIRRIERASPDLGEHFRRSVRTGAYCSYDPVVEVHWRV